MLTVRSGRSPDSANGCSATVRSFPPPPSIDHGPIAWSWAAHPPRIEAPQPPDTPDHTRAAAAHACVPCSRSHVFYARLLSVPASSSATMRHTARRFPPRRRAKQLGHRLTNGLAGRALVEEKARRGVDLEAVVAVVGRSPEVDARDFQAQRPCRTHARDRDRRGYLDGLGLDRLAVASRVAVVGCVGHDLGSEHLITDRMDADVDAKNPLLELRWAVPDPLESGAKVVVGEGAHNRANPAQGFIDDLVFARV